MLKTGSHADFFYTKIARCHSGNAMRESSDERVDLVLALMSASKV
jgi:hypothetical protein